MAIHVDPTALVDPDAVLDDDVSVGPYSVIGPGAFVGAGTRILNHVTIQGNVRMGVDNVVYPNCVIGTEPQDTSYRGSPTWVVIGDRNMIREAVTIHRATEKELGITRIGSDNYIMCGCHIGHDSNVGSHIHMANCTTLGGHVYVQDYASMSGLIGVHHFVTIGSHSFVGGMARVVKDVPPFMLVEGHPGVVRCVNLVGVKRRGYSQEEIRGLTEAHRLLYRVKMNYDPAKEMLTEAGKMIGPVQTLFAFLQDQRQGRNGRARERLRAA